MEISIALDKISLVPFFTFRGVLKIGRITIGRDCHVRTKVTYLENVRNEFDALRSELFQSLLRTTSLHHMSVILENIPLLRHVMNV